jgi:hypothetical protein
MKRHSITLVLLLLAGTSPAIGEESADLVRAVKNSHPMVLWQAHRVLKANLTCLGHQDLAVLGTEETRTIIAILAKGRSKRPIVLEIDSDLSAASVTFTVESQDFEIGDGKHGDVAPLPGFKRSKTCKGLRLDDDRIDSVHIYWNRAESRFQTWQR